MSDVAENVIDLASARQDRCRCQGDGANYAYWGDCPVHAEDPDSSPLKRAVDEAWERRIAAAREAANGA